MHSIAHGAPCDECVVDQRKAILNSEFESTASADADISDEIPRPALHGLKAEGIEVVVVNAIVPHSHIGKAVVWLQPVIRDIVDVIAVNVAVTLRIGDTIGHTGDIVVGNDVAARMVQFDSFPTDTSRDGIVVADDDVIRDMPVPARGFECDGVVEAVKAASSNHHVRRVVGCPESV